LAGHFGVGTTTIKNRLEHLDRLGLVETGGRAGRALGLPSIRFEAVVEGEPNAQTLVRPRLVG
jgi:hypothetical protein